MSKGSSSRPLVSIGIPTYNRADGYLKEALESALAQTYPNVEIVVADNCSPDATQAVVASYADPRVRYFRHEPGLKPNDNFNFCLRQAKGEYFLLLHDDDMVDKDFISSCLEAARYRSDIGVLRTGTRVIDSQGIVLREQQNRAVGLSTAEFFLAWFEGITALYICSTLFNTRRLKDIGGFGSRHNLFQDDVAGLTLAARYGRADVPDVKASFRVHTGELTKAARVADWCEDSLDLLALMCELAPERQREIRKRGMRFFATINYSRATHVKPLSQEIAAIALVFRRFGYRYLPPLRLVLSETALYRELRRVKRKIMGLPEYK